MGASRLEGNIAHCTCCTLDTVDFLLCTLRNVHSAQRAPHICILHPVSHSTHCTPCAWPAHSLPPAHQADSGQNSVQCTAYRILNVDSAHCTLSALHSGVSRACNVRCALCTLQIVLHTTHCALYALHIAHSAYCKWAAHSAICTSTMHTMHFGCVVCSVQYAVC